MFSRFWSKVISVFVRPPILHPIDQIKTNLPAWYNIALVELGTTEKPGEGDNPRVLEYHKVTSLRANRDSVPWCSSFVSWCLEKANFKSMRSAWARSYLEFGTKLREPKPGCIVILSRGANSGHVGFYVKSNLLTVTLLGGNQSDCVCFADYPKWRVLGYRWPHV